MNLRTISTDAIDSPLADLLFNRSAVPMWVLDVTGSVVRANEAARASFTGKRPVFVDLMNEALDDEMPRTGTWTAMIPVIGEDETAVRMNASLTSMNDDASHFLCTLQPSHDASSIGAVAGVDHPPETVSNDAAQAQDSGPAMMWMAGPDMQRDWFSQPWLDFTGAALADQRSDGWLAGIHPEDLERFRGIVEASTQARYPFTLDYRLRRQDGVYRWMMDTGLPRYAGDGAFCGYVGSCIEIHERKELEDRLAERTRALRLADRRKDDFLAMLSHELRNPLAPIANAAGLLRLMEKDNAPLARVRVIVERQVEQLRRLISDMVDMTRLTQHRISLSPRPVSIDSLIAGAVGVMQGRIEAAGHTVEVESSQPDAEVEADPVRLQQAVANLLANAVKFTQRPGIIRIKADIVDDLLAISVTDHGDGIQPDFLPHVFELFAQQDQSTARAHGGLGIGLTIARRIVQLHGGDIEACSEGTGRGSVFVIRMPLRRSARDESSGENTRTTPCSSSSSSSGSGYSSSSPLKGTVEYSLSRL